MGGYPKTGNKWGGDCRLLGAYNQGKNFWVLDLNFFNVLT
jgi:hypothetical protein